MAFPAGASSAATSASHAPNVIHTQIFAKVLRASVLRAHWSAVSGAKVPRVLRARVRRAEQAPPRLPEEGRVAVLHDVSQGGDAGNVHAAKGLRHVEGGLREGTCTSRGSSPSAGDEYVMYGPSLGGAAKFTTKSLRALAPAANFSVCALITQLQFAHQFAFCISREWTQVCQWRSPVPTGDLQESTVLKWHQYARARVLPR